MSAYSLWSGAETVVPSPLAESSLVFQGRPYKERDMYSRSANTSLASSAKASRVALRFTGRSVADIGLSFQLSPESVRLRTGPSSLREVHARKSRATWALHALQHPACLWVTLLKPPRLV